MSTELHAISAKRWQVWTAMAIIYIVWGSTFLAIRVMVATIPPLLGAGIRFLIPGIILLAIIAVARGSRHIRKVNWTQFWALALIGMVLLPGSNGLLTVAEQDLPSGLAALLVATIPVFVVLLRLLSGDRTTVSTLLGVVVGLIGVAFLVLPNDHMHSVPLIPSLLALTAAALWAAMSFATQRLSLPEDPFVCAAWMMIAGGVVMITIGIGSGELTGLQLGSLAPNSVLAFVYLAVTNSLLAYTASVWLTRNAPISLVSTYAYVNPLIAVLLGWWLLNESVSVTTAVAAALIITSTVLIVSRESAYTPKPQRLP